MNNIAMIIAGGIGSRLGDKIPKQFVKINGIPIIIYTLIQFNKHPEISEIGVVCLEQYISYLSNLCEVYSLNKVKWIIPGEKTGFLSIHEGIKQAQNLYKADDLILIHDAVRPMVSAEVISDCIRVAKVYGNATASIACTTVVLKKSDNGGLSSNEVIDRNNIMLTQTPQAFSLKLISELHDEAILNKKCDLTATCTIMASLNRSVYFSKGDGINIKLTTPADLVLLKSLISNLRLIDNDKF